MTTNYSYLAGLSCPICGRVFDAGRVQTCCPDCASPLEAVYDLGRAGAEVRREAIAARPKGLWRWHELLPASAPGHTLSLGEGDTPLLPLPRTGSALGLRHLYLKDESLNPTGSFKARGLAVAVARAAELGVKRLVIPTAGNAGGALAFYASRAGLQARVYMPADTPEANQIETRMAGAEVVLVDGLINLAGKQAGELAATGEWFDMSTFKEPYRMEGKKIMGYELAEAFGWSWPEVIIYPTGGGMGLVAIWKAVRELSELGWVLGRPPRMVAVQAAGCAPVVRAFEQGRDACELWEGAETLASGLRVPKSFGDKLIMRCLRESGGTALAVSDEQILAAQRRLAREEGIFAAPEGAANLAALEQLAASGWLRPDERVVLLNTGTGLKYLDRAAL